MHVSHAMLSVDYLGVSKIMILGQDFELFRFHIMKKDTGFKQPTLQEAN